MLEEESADTSGEAWEIYERLLADAKAGPEAGDGISVHMYEIQAGIMHGSETITVEA